MHSERGVFLRERGMEQLNQTSYQFALIGNGEVANVIADSYSMILLLQNIKF